VTHFWKPWLLTVATLVCTHYCQILKTAVINCDNITPCPLHMIHRYHCSDETQHIHCWASPKQWQMCFTWRGYKDWSYFSLSTFCLSPLILYCQLLMLLSIQETEGSDHPKSGTTVDWPQEVHALYIIQYFQVVQDGIQYTYLSKLIHWGLLETDRSSSAGTL